MIYPVYSVRDLKGDFYAPRIDQSDASCIRWFSMTVNTPETMTNFAPSDFQLFKIGEFDSVTGRLTPLDLPQLLTSGLDVFGRSDIN